MGRPDSTRAGRTRLGALAVLGAAALALPATGAQAAAGPVSADAAACGRISLKSGGQTHAFTVRIDKGTVTCGLAKRTVRAYLSGGASPRGWFCVRGHASQHQRWAAACASAGGADVKAFAVRKS